jgi:hypothetical protein
LILFCAVTAALDTSIARAAFPYRHLSRRQREQKNSRHASAAGVISLTALDGALHPVLVIWLIRPARASGSFDQPAAGLNK